MLSAVELKRRAGKEGMPQATIEKDFALSVALAVIADAGLAKQRLVFKGGTAIKKIYFEKARYSEDLDFSVRAMDRQGILVALKEALEGKSIEGLSFNGVEEEETTAGLKVAVKFTGPLAHPQRIRFDFSFRENLVEQPVEKEIIDTYGLGKRSLLVLTLGEILAEKIHSLGWRIAPRDLYDVWFLLGKGIKPEKEIIDKKFSYYNERYEKEKLAKNIEKSREGWKGELERLVKRLPDFENVRMEVVRKL